MVHQSYWEFCREALDGDLETVHAVGVCPTRMFYDLNNFLDLYNFRELGCYALSIESTRALASTTDGHIGWIPDTSQPNDIICVFKGGPFPFVIRERGDGYCSLIGDAYIQGIEHGEAWPEDEADTYMIGLK